MPQVSLWQRHFRQVPLWPFPEEGLGAAVAEGYLALGEAGQPGDAAAGGIS